MPCQGVVCCASTEPEDQPPDRLEDLSAAQPDGQPENQPDNPLLFPSEASTPILPRNLVRQFKELLQKAKLPATIRFHDLRHFAATTLLTNGADVTTTQAILGRTDASVTLNFYAPKSDTNGGQRGSQRGNVGKGQGGIRH